MLVIRKLINNIVNPGVVTTLWGETSFLGRYFINLDPTASAHYSIDTPITLTGDYTISYASTTSGTAMNFADGFGISAAGLFVAPASVTDIELNGVSVGLGAAAPIDGKLNTVKFIGAVAENITVIGQNGAGANYFDGILSNTIIDNSGTLTTFALDEPTANTELSLEGDNSVTYVNVAQDERESFIQDGDDWLGGELIANGDFSGGSSDWTLGDGWSVSGGSASYDGLNGDQKIINSQALSSLGSIYRIEINVTDTTSVVAANPAFFGGRFNILTLPVGLSSFEWQAQEDMRLFEFFAKGDAGDIFTIDNVSVKRLIEVG